jgi:hypothetical protein
MRNILLAGILLLTSCTARTTEQNVLGTALDPMETRKLLAKAVKYSRYPMPLKQPIVDVIPEDLWLKLACPGLTSDTCLLLGFYIDYLPTEVNVVHVRDSLDKMRPFQGTAVHELVHWLQSRNGRRYTPNNCALLAANEMEAYAIEYVNDLANNHARAFQMGDILGACLVAHGIEPRVR